MQSRVNVFRGDLEAQPIVLDTFRSPVARTKPRLPRLAATRCVLLSAELASLAEGEGEATPAEYQLRKRQPAQILVRVGARRRLGCHADAVMAVRGRHGEHIARAQD